MIHGLPNGVILEVETAIERAWNGGFVTEVRLRNLSSVPLEDWALDLDLAPGVRMRNAAHAEASQDGSRLTLVPDRPWLRTIGPDERVSLTFRSDGAVEDVARDVAPAAIRVGGARYDLGPESVPVPEPGAPPSLAILSDVIVKASWGGGAWVQIVLTNEGTAPVTDWTLPIALPPGLRFASSGNARLATGADGTPALEPGKGFLATIAPGQTVVLGLNLAGDASLLDRFSVGALTGSVPPTAVNDRDVAYAFDGASGTATFAAADLLANDADAGGGPVELRRAFTVAGGGVTVANGDGTITYSTVRRDGGAVVSADAGRVVVGYEIADRDGLTDTAQVTIDLPEAPRLLVSDVAVDESAGTALFEVTLVGDTTLDAVAVDWETRARSALAGADFTAAGGALTFSDTERTRTVAVALIDDGARELTESFDLVLSNARGAVIEGLPARATLRDDAADAGRLGETTPGIAFDVTLAGEYVVGWTARITATNVSDAPIADPVVTVGVQDGMAPRGHAGARLLANHDDRYLTFGLDLPAAVAAGAAASGFDNLDLADGSFDPGDTATFDLVLRGAHFFAPLEDRIEVAPTTLEAEAPERPFVPLDLKRQGFNTAFFNRAEVTDADVEATFEDAAAIGANAAAIVTTHFAAGRRSSSIYANDFTMTDADLREAIRAAQGEGLSVLLKPHLDLADGAFRGRLDPADDARFFGRQADGTYAAGSYGELITRYARIAQEEGVETLLVGTELVDLAKDRANLPLWTALIADVRAIYDGTVSYATIVGEELFVRFWDQLDAISLDIYPPLTDNAGPSVGELTQGWTDTPTTARSLEAYFGQPILDLIAGMAERYDRPVLITETGFRSVDGIAGRPFDFALQGPADLGEQADAYEALFAALERGAGAFLEGLYLWEWPTRPAPEDGTIRDPDGYEPVNKPAMDVIADFFDLG